MGDKIESRKLVSKLGLNPVPGQLKPSRLRREAIKDAESFGYPVALKSAHGGGGKGLRIVQNEAELVGVKAEKLIKRNVNTKIVL